MNLARSSSVIWRVVTLLFGFGLLYLSALQRSQKGICPFPLRCGLNLIGLVQRWLLTLLTQVVG